MPDIQQQEEISKPVHKNGGSLRCLLAFAGLRARSSISAVHFRQLQCLCRLVPMYASGLWLETSSLWHLDGSRSAIAPYGWWAFGFAAASIALYFAALMCTHLAAFRCASNMRKRAIDHLMRANLGYFDAHASGALRRIVDGCAAETESLLAHKLPDAIGSASMVVGMLTLFFVFDWRLGAVCLVPIVVSVVCMARMMGGRGMDFMQLYMDSLVKMNKTGTEYVRGIPVVKVFRQTVYSLRAFHDAIEEFTKFAQEYSLSWCRVPQSISLTAINAAAILLVPATVLLVANGQDVARLLANVAFYAIFTAIIPTVMIAHHVYGRGISAGSRCDGACRGGAGGPRLFGAC